MITPKNIGKGANLQQYYVNYAQEHGEAPGKWFGVGAKSLGLEGTVQAEDMQQLLRGYSPRGEALCRNAGENHRGGWDFTFSPPKSVSIVWSNASKDLREKIEKIQERSVLAGMQYFQDHSAFVRTGEQGKRKEAANLLFALFQHSSNRAEEPQLHTHSIIFNVAQSRSDGKWRTPESRDIYKSYMAASAYYKANFAHELKELGIEVERTKDSFEIVGIPREVCDAQSSRSKQIEEELLKRGLDRNSASARSKEAANLSTRMKKKGIVRDFEKWQKENTLYGFGPEEQSKTLSQMGRNLTKELSIEEQEHLRVETLETLTRDNSTFTDHQIRREFAEQSIGKQSVHEIRSQTKKIFERDDLFSVGIWNKDLQFTTENMYDIEKKLIDCIESRIGENKHNVSLGTIEKVLKARPTIEKEQIEALEHVTRDGNGISFVQGVAGAGKSYTMDAVREAFEMDGYQVLGLSPTNKAASELEKSSQIKSTSIDSFLYKIRNEGVEVDKNTVIIIDEGAMADSRKTYLLNEFARQQSLKLIYVGDSPQIQPILAGQAFGTSVKKFGAAELKNVIRQKNKEEAQAILHIRDGNLDKTIDYYEKKKAFHFSETRLDSEKKMIEDWGQYISQNKDKSAFMIATTNKSVDRLNTYAREILKKNNMLQDGIQFQTKKGPLEVSLGDKLIFTDNLKEKGIFRSEIVTVKALNEEKVIVLKGEKKDIQEITFSPKEFNSFKHGYALTAHKSQGSTADRSFVLVDGHNMDREKFYVALSRGRENNQIYVDKDAVGGLQDYHYEKLEGLGKEEFKEKENVIYRQEIKKILGKSNMKVTTQDFEIKDEVTLKKVSLIAEKNINSIRNSFTQLQRDFEMALKAGEKEDLKFGKVQEKSIEKEPIIEKKINRFSKEKAMHREREIELEL